MARPTSICPALVRPGVVGDHRGVSTEQTPPEPTAPPQRSHYAMGTAANMVRSLLVILAIVIGLVLIIPRTSSDNRPPVEVHPAAVAAERDVKWGLSEPTGLPAGWKATSVRFVTSTDKLRTWHVGYLTPDENYVALEQTKGATDEWVAAQTQRAKRTGERQAAGRTWATYDRDSKVQRSLLDRPEAADGLTTLVTGTGTWEELAVFAEHLTPIGS